MDNLLILIILAAAILAIAALPRLTRGREDSAEPAARPASKSGIEQASKPARPPTAAEIDADPFTRWLCDQACTQTGADLRRDPLALMRIADAAAKARVEIEGSGKTEISLPFITANASGPKHFTLKVGREQMASLPRRMA